jgi:hypothetical protein
MGRLSPIAISMVCGVPATASTLVKSLLDAKCESTITQRGKIWLVLAFTALASVGMYAAPKKQADPKISSIYPMTGQRGRTFEAALRGSNLADVRALMFEGGGVEARILSVNADQPDAGNEAAKDHPAELVKVQFAIHAETATGRHAFRVITPRGVSNELALYVTSEPVLNEVDATRPLKRFPIVINGRIAHPGDTISYSIEVTGGETLTFEAASAADGFDPSLALYEPTGSWFDPHRVNQVASNDEPLSFPGLSKDARIVQRFPHNGLYNLRVQGFGGQGGSDCVYQLRIVPGVTPLPLLHPVIKANWEERQFTRDLTDRRMEELRLRSALGPEAGAIETFRAVPEDAKEIPVMTTPGVVEGRIDRPGQAQIIHLKVEKPQAIAMEVQTPEATLPRFNPVVRLLSPDGHEIATDVYTKLNNNGLYMMKMIEAKTTVDLTAPGEYTIQVRDITTNGAGSNFLYRILVRPQVPHVGKIEVAEDHINLEVGSSHPVTVTIDREEGFNEYVTLDVEGLPAGVTTLPALEDHVEPPPLPNGGRLERYVAKQQQAAVMLAASDSAQLTGMPVRVRLVARLLHEGHLSTPIAAKEIWLMVIPPGTS